MSLTQAIEDLKKEIAEKEVEDTKDATEEQETHEETAEQETEKPEEPKEEVKEEEKPAEKEEPKVEEAPDKAAMIRMRREAAAAKKKAEALEAELTALKAAPKEVEEIVKPEIDPDIAAVVEDHKYKQAEREFQRLENQFKSSTPDYDDVSAEYALALAQSIKIQNPRMSNTEVAEETKKSLLLKASAYMRDGFNPIEELYHEAKDLGLTGTTMQKLRNPIKEEPKAEEDIRPDMNKVAKNRARSSGMASSSGKSEGIMTKAAAAELSAEEWQRLPVTEKRRLMYG